MENTSILHPIIKILHILKQIKEKQIQHKPTHKNLPPKQIHKSFR